MLHTRRSTYLTTRKALIFGPSTVLFIILTAAMTSGITDMASSGPIMTKGNIYYLPVTNTTTYTPKVWNDYNQWHSSDVGTYTYNGAYDCQMHAEQDDGNIKLDVLMGMLNDTTTWVQDHYANGIRMIGRNLTIEAEVSNFAVSASARWLRIAVVACVNLDSPFHDPIYGSDWSQVFMEFDWYWHSGTRAGEGGNFRFVKVGQFEPGTGYHHLSLDFTQTFIQHYGQSAYDQGTLWYVTASTIELSNANATIRVKPITLLESRLLP